MLHFLFVLARSEEDRHRAVREYQKEAKQLHQELQEKTKRFNELKAEFDQLQKVNFCFVFYLFSINCNFLGQRGGTAGTSATVPRRASSIGGAIECAHATANGRYGTKT